MSDDEKLRELFYDVNLGHMTVHELIAQSGLDPKKVRQWYDAQTVNQVMHYQKPKYHTIVSDRFSWFIDLVFYEQYFHENKSHSIIFVAIESTSRFAVAYPCKTKQISDVFPIIKTFIKDNEVQEIASDNEGAFKSNAVRNYLASNAINQVFHDSGDHTSLGVLDRFVRTLRHAIEYYFVAFQTRNWIDVLQKIIGKYNNTVHSTLDGHTPREVYESQDLHDHIHDLLIKRDEKAQRKKNQFKVGDRVRHINTRNKFDKGNPQFSTDIYTISAIDGNRIKLKTESGNPVVKRYPYWGLKKVTDVDAYKPSALNPVKEKGDARMSRIMKQEGLDTSLVDQPKQKRTIKAPQRLDL
jgi:hypothetical protein